MHDPIIDMSRHPLSQWRGARSTTPIHATGRFLWLNVLRPLLLLVVWVLAGWYLYRGFVQATSYNTDDARFLHACALMVIALLVAMMLIARAIRAAQEKEQSRQARQPAMAPTPLALLADYAKVPANDLAAWQQARNVVALHDEHGRLRGTTPREAAPVQSSAA